MSIEINNIKNNPLPSPSDLLPDGQRTGVAFKTNPLLQDKVEISLKKKGLSDGAKIGIGIGALTLIGVGIYKRKSLKTLWEKIFGKGNKKPPEKPNKPSEPNEVPNKPKPEGVNECGNAPQKPERDKPNTNNEHIQEHNQEHTPTNKPNNNSTQEHIPEPTQSGEQNINDINFSILTKNGKKYDLKLEKHYYILDGIFGKTTDISYKITDTKTNNIVGSWSGAVLVDSDGKKYIKGHLIDTRKEGIAHVEGLGTKIKEFIHQEAVKNGCNRIEIDAAYGSHVFHNKMGYKSNFYNSNNSIQFAKDILNAIKNKNALPEYSSKIGTVINSNDANKMNELIDEILKVAGERRLRSQELGIFGRMIPMVQYL